MTRPPAPGDGGIRLQGLTKTFSTPQGQVHADRGIDLWVAAGETAPSSAPTAPASR